MRRKPALNSAATDAACNLYLASALLLAAGLEGITNEIEPNAPTTENVEHLNEEERAEKEIGSLPGTLLDALDALNNSSFARNVLGDGIVEIFLKQKRQEYDDFLKARENGIDAEMEWEYIHYLLRY